jgi:hypothetical protein
VVLELLLAPAGLLLTLPVPRHAASRPALEVRQALQAQAQAPASAAPQLAWAQLPQVTQQTESGPEAAAASAVEPQLGAVLALLQQAAVAQLLQAG